MKFLHLSDLHIGKTVNGFSMLDEQRHVFAQVIGYIEAERPDALVIAGDVYDRAVPGVDAVRLFDDFLTALSGAGVPALVVAGNHDSPERLNYASRLLSDKGIHLCGAFNGELSHVVFQDEFGEARFWLLPFIKPSMLRGVLEDGGIDGYGDAVSAALESADIDYGGRNVLVAHQFFVKPGVEPLRSESELSPVGGLDAVNVDIASRFDYVALGHLHGAQTVGFSHIRYAGSPAKYSFSEWRQKKSITMVELRGKGELEVTALPLAPLHDMREIKGRLDALLREGTNSQAGREDYLRAVLTDEEEIADPMGKLRSVYPNVMGLEFENSRTGLDLPELSASLDKVETLSTYELFGEFFLDISGAVMSEEQAETVRELLETMENETT